MKFEKTIFFSFFSQKFLFREKKNYSFFLNFFPEKKIKLKF